VKDGQARSKNIRRWSVIGVLAAASVGGFFALKGCEDEAARDVQAVKLGGEWFHLEIADKESVRMKGLGQRTYIAPDGGMLFVFSPDFPRKFPQGTGFVMRDCPIDIDIIYLDPNGRITAMHAMKAERPRGEGEGAVGDLSNPTYEGRLKSYPSRYAIQGAIELAGGTIEKKLKGKIKEGDKVDLPLEALKKRAE